VNTGTAFALAGYQTTGTTVGPFGNGTSTGIFSDARNDLSIAPSAASSGSPTLFTLTGPAHTALAAGVEASDVLLNLNRTVQFATGALGTQRAIIIQPPAYSFAAASTITNSSLLTLTGPPTAGTNATLTNQNALWVQNGATSLTVPNQVAPFGSSIFVTASRAANSSTFGNIFEIGAYTSNTGTAPNVAIFGQATTNGAGAQAWGGNFVGFIGSGSDSAATAHGIEVDYGRLINTTAACLGVLIVSGGTNGNTAHLWMQSAASSASPTDGIMFAKSGTIQPVTGSLINTTGSPAVTNGVNFVNCAFSGNAFASPGYQVDGSGNLTFTTVGASNRIKGDFSSAVQSTRVLFQDSTTNNNTVLGIIPNGTATTAGINIASTSDINNSGLLQLLSLSGNVFIKATVTGTGTQQGMIFAIGNSNTMAFNSIADMLYFGAISNSENLSFRALTTTVNASNGASTITATNFFPSGFVILGVVSRVVTAFNGTLTSLSIGDGSAATQWSNTTGITLGTLTGLVNAASAPKFYASASNLVITANGGTFGTSGTIRVTAYGYFITSPAS
jgi:hypothetical protein